jgi:transposase
MRPHGSPEQLAKRRRKAVALNREGYGPAGISRLLKTTPQSVCRWLREYGRNGAAGLDAEPVPGRPQKLNARQRRALVGCLLKGAGAFGFATDLWTCPRIAQLIEQRFAVHYHVDAIPRVMATLGFSPSKARTPRGRTRRGGYRPLDPEGLAADQATGRTSPGPPGFHR